MKNMRLAVALGSMFWISNVFATIVSYNITVSSDSWSNSGVLPYGVAEQPTFSGTFKVDTGLPASSNVIDLNMVTGSQTWTQATLGSTSSLYPMVGGQGLLLGAGSGLGRLDISVASSANINSFMLTDPKSGAIQCQNCVSLSATTNTTPPLAPFPTQNLKVNGPLYQNNTLPNSEYALSFDGTAFIASFDLGFYGADPGAALINTWTMGIEDTWSNKYYIHDGNASYPLFIDANLSFNNPEADFQIEVRNELADMTGNWPELRVSGNRWFTHLGAYGPDFKIPYSNGQDYMQADLAAHEFGHWLGIDDEYYGSSKCINTMPDYDLGVMGCWMELIDGSFDLAPARPRYFASFLSDISSITDRSVFGFMPIVPSFDHTGETFGTGASDVVSRSVPEPNSLFLVAIGFAALARKRVQKGSLTK